ncbi:MAG TPA: aromatic-ring-hydroxylating dioxygenase subunit beta [Dehalococcoidia bacterium]|nr:aromatic-ring-hydroxylating dioxygenase subunit beta [Dehalococcoidia bacterium]
MAVDRHEIESFLYKEARLMDEHQFDEWQSLWTEDAVYWVPCDYYDVDPTKHVSIIYDNKDGIAARIGRMKSNMAWSQDPRSRLRRVVSNIEIEEQDNGEIVVYSNFDLTEIRRRSQKTWQYTWAGRTMHRLRRENGDWKMAFKKVMLVNNDDAVPTLWFLI